MRTFIRPVLTVVFLLAPIGIFAADLDKGLAAFNEGDYETAMAECQPLADEGNVEAMFCVGRMYANGFGVDMNDDLALKWYGMAADAGHAEAQYSLGVMHANGWGVAMDDGPAAEYYKMAADQGFPPALTAMGFSYKHGAGVELDYVKAVMWFDIAAQRGDLTAAGEREDLSDSMTAEQLQSAQQAALDWLSGFDGDMQAGRSD